MAKFPLDLGKFKKVGGDKHTTVMRHEDGHEMRVMHSALKPEMRKALESLPAAMAQGGDVPNLKENYSSSKKKSNKIQYFEAGGEASAQSSSGDASSASPTQDGNSQDQQASAPAAQPVAAPAPVVVNVNGAGPTPPAPQATPAAPAPQANNFTQGPGGPVFDFNKAAMSDPNAPIEAKTRALEAMNAQAEQAKQGQASSAQSERDKILAYNIQAQKAGLPALPVPGAPESGGVAPSQAAPQAAAPSQGGGQPDTFGTDAYSKNYMEGVNQQMSGIRGEANAAGQQAKQEAAVYQQAIANQQKNAQSYQDHYAALEKERQSFMNDIKNFHIEPNHYLSSMGVGQKILTGIGVVLGGSEGAINYVQDQINKDIDAQKTELGKRENLLSANMKQFGNLRDATEMTRVMQMDIVANQLKEQAAKSTDPLVQARANQAIGKLKVEAAPLMAQLAMKKAILSGVASGSVSPARAINMGIVPADQRAEANKELSQAQEAVNTRDNVASAFNQLTTVNTLGQRIFNPLSSSKDAAALMKPLIAALSKATAGRFSEADSSMIAPLFPTPGDTQKNIDVKRVALMKLISEKMSPNNYPILHTYGLAEPLLNARYNAAGASVVPESKPLPGKKK